MKSLAAVVLSLLCLCSAEQKIYHVLLNTTLPYPLPDLPFGYDELEPFIDEATLRVHHTGHHKAYTTKMNSALEEWRNEAPDSELAHSSIIDILQHIKDVPEKYQIRLRNHGGGYVNHIFYWATLCPVKQASRYPEGQLGEDLKLWFGSVEDFELEFMAKAASLFGSGYVWLVEDGEGMMSIQTSSNQDSPLSDNLYPLLVVDVWEHAYYLKHQNKRLGYLGDWLNLSSYEKVTQLQQFWREVGKVQEKNKKTEL